MGERWTSRDRRPTGFAVDAAPENRPGVPRERDARDPGAWWEHPEQQRGAEAVVPAGLRGATPVFGTAQRPRGLSGAVRRLAYRVPEHRAGRWALLLLGDRLDVIEHRLARNLWIVPAAAALGLGYLVAARALERR
jgi:hypothetical protein